VGRLAHELPPPTGDAASQPMCQLVWRGGCSEDDQTLTSSGGSAADVTPSAANGAAVEPLIADFAAAQPLRALLCTPAFSGPATGMAGDRGGDLAGAAPSEAQRSAANCKPVSSPSGPRSRAA